LSHSSDYESRSRARGLRFVTHSVFEISNGLSKPFSEIGDTTPAEEQNGDAGDDQKLRRSDGSHVNISKRQMLMVTASA
jgi:hypothetical protein